MAVQQNFQIQPTSKADIIASIKPIFNDLFERCGVPDAGSTVHVLDQNLFDDAKEALSAEPFLLPSSMYPRFDAFLSTGVLVAQLTYPHLQHKFRIYVALYTALGAAVDDLSFETDSEFVESFNERFIQGLPQGHPVSEAFAVLTREAAVNYFNRPQAALITTCTLDFLASLSMDTAVREMENLADYPSFVDYWRMLSGLPKAFAVFLFPPDIPFASYVHTLPYISVYINGVNDVLSFYKEELAMDEDNYPSKFAKGSATLTKYDVIQRVVDDVVEADKITLKGLASNPQALDCWNTFRSAWVPFHIVCPRYRLRELYGKDEEKI
ncbi:hypothetical protein PM082_013852 [Marasmius tenuissimus]|nr:hypothetical protein PM082_013852 [Marasmius tenuissimus]